MSSIYLLSLRQDLATSQARAHEELHDRWPRAEQMVRRRSVFFLKHILVLPEEVEGRRVLFFSR